VSLCVFVRRFMDLMLGIFCIMFNFISNNFIYFDVPSSVVFLLLLHLVFLLLYLHDLLVLLVLYY
jgi:hypothetical protein